MVKNVLITAGFIEGKTFKETRFIKAPLTTYAVYMDSYASRGSDDKNFIKEHEYTIELYSSKPDPSAEVRIEDTFNKLGITYEKQDRLWIDKEQLYQVIYEFEHIEK